MFEKKSLATRPQEAFGVLRQMTSELDRMFDEPWSLFRWPAAEFASPDGTTWAPKVDVMTKDGNLVTHIVPLIERLLNQPG